ncbi:MAG TPA: helix-turn-helix domain-containing protein [Candidatus Binatia bacterium]
MGQQYGQLTLEERCQIAQLSQAGKTIRQIAAAMDRAPSTIARERRRNACAGMTRDQRAGALEAPVR